MTSLNLEIPQLNVNGETYVTHTSVTVPSKPGVRGLLLSTIGWYEVMDDGGWRRMRWTDVVRVCESSPSCLQVSTWVDTKKGGGELTVDTEYIVRNPATAEDLVMAAQFLSRQTWQMCFESTVVPAPEVFSAFAVATQVGQPPQAVGKSGAGKPRLLVLSTHRLRVFAYQLQLQRASSKAASASASKMTLKTLEFDFLLERIEAVLVNRSTLNIFCHSAVDPDDEPSLSLSFSSNGPLSSFHTELRAVYFSRTGRPLINRSD